MTGYWRIGILVSIWLYTLVFAFSSLWFAHYLLAVLQRLRRDESDAVSNDTVGGAAAPPALEPPRGFAA